jgi:uracil-DNA glycosylase
MPLTCETIKLEVAVDVMLSSSNPSLEPFAHTIGPRSTRLAIVAESWGEREDLFKVPLVGWSGVELARMMSEAGLGPSFFLPHTTAMEPYMMSHWQSTGYLYTNVFAERPENNEIESWCLSKKELPDVYETRYFKPGKYFKPEMLSHLDRLKAELALVKPNLILALGAVSSWALLGSAGISSIRGSTAWSEFANCKVLPTFHPSFVLRNWSARTIVLQDLIKARREMEFPEIRRPKRWVTISPRLEDIREWMMRPATHYAVDIETVNKQISMVGFARSASDGIVIPFILDKKSYWPTVTDELLAWKLVKELLEGPQIKIFQNGLYDLSYLASMGFKPRNCTEDTMLLHHSLYPEMRKGLGFLGSIYTDESSWKLMRNHSNKREE